MALRKKRPALPLPRDHGALVQSVEGLVRQTARRFWFRASHNGALTMEDLCSAGREGAFRAAQRFDPGRGLRFTTYATHWISAYIRREVENFARTIRVPVPVQKRVFKGAGSENQRLRSTYNGGVVSLDAKVGSADLTIADRAVDPSESALDAILGKEIDRGLFTAVRELDARERLILVARFRDEKTLREIGEGLGLSRERVRQIEARAFAKLRRLLRKE